jgi:hypothetical protein
LADIAVSVGGTRSVSAAKGSRTSTIHAAFATPKPTNVTDASTIPQIASRVSPSQPPRAASPPLHHRDQTP